MKRGDIIYIQMVEGTGSEIGGMESARPLL